MRFKEMDIYTEDNVKLALMNQMGNLGLAAAELNVSRGQLLDYLAHHPEIGNIRKQIKEAVKDDAEDLLIDKMKTDNTLLMFYLRTQARDRGYGSELSMTGPNGGAIEVNVNARTLIAAMRNGTSNVENQKSEEQDSDLLFQPELLPINNGS